MKPELLISAAAANGKPERLKELLDKDPGLAKSHDPDGWTPLHIAGHFGQKVCAEILLEAGADPSAKSTNVYENQPLHAAVLGQNSELIQLLLEWGADPNAPEADGSTPLHRAAERGELAIVELLLNGGANPHAVDKAGRVAGVAALERGHEEILHLLRSHGEERED